MPAPGSTGSTRTQHSNRHRPDRISRPARVPGGRGGPGPSAAGSPVLPPTLFEILFRPKPIFHLQAMPAPALLPVGVCQGGDLFICRRNAWRFNRLGGGDRFGPKTGTVGSSEEMGHLGSENNYTTRLAQNLSMRLRRPAAPEYSDLMESGPS